MHKEFKVHILNPEGIQKAKKIAQLFDDLLTGLEPIASVASREMAIVRTKLEEAAFFAKKAMANIPENQKEKV